MKVLFVAPYLPSRVRIRPFQWIQALAANGCDIHLVCLAPPEDRWASDEPLRSACQRIDRFALSRAQTLANAARAVATGVPLQALYSRHREAIAHIAALAPRFDVVHIEHLRGVVMAEGVTTIPIVVDAVDSITLLFEHPTVRSLARLLAGAAGPDKALAAAADRARLQRAAMARRRPVS